METIERDYSPKGVKFYYVYKALAHPETNGYITPFTLDERLMHVKEAKRTLGTRFNWICDTMSNDIKHSLGDAPNCEFVIDPEGKVVRKRVWSRPDELRKDLEELVGPVEKPTTVAELNMQTPPRPKQAAIGVVPRIELPGRLQAVKVEPIIEDKKTPFYVKLRAEADSALISGGEGKLYLGFFLDPLYHVHWNNQAEPMRFELTLPKDVTASPSSGTGPKVDEPADSDPREFLIDVNGKQSRKPIELTVHYFACDDAETFCIPVTQTYLVYLESDRDGGSRMGAGRGGPPALAGGPGGRGPAGAPGGPREMMRRLLSFDRDGDGKVSIDEAPPQMREFMFARLDTNEDGFVDRAEIEARFSRPGPPFGPPGERPRPDQPDETNDSTLDNTKPADIAARYLKYAQSIVAKYDANADGALSPDEWAKMSNPPANADTNGDKRITVEELVDWYVKQ